MRVGTPRPKAYATKSKFGVIYIFIESFFSGHDNMGVKENFYQSLEDS